MTSPHHAIGIIAAISAATAMTCLLVGLGRTIFIGDDRGPDDGWEMKVFFIAFCIMLVSGFAFVFGGAFLEVLQ